MQNNETYDENDIENERIKLVNIKQRNIATINKLKLLMELLDKIDTSLNKQSHRQLNDLINMKHMLEENTDIFKIICENFI
jgi:hypothetical protein